MTPATPTANAPAFPAGCPKCGEPAGLPYLAATSCEDDCIHLGLRCAQCAHEWHSKMPSVTPKFDRRAFPRGN